MAYDTIFAGGMVVDGTGAPPFRADVGVSGDRIAVVGDLSAAAARERIDCTGLAVSPGFIDVHSHYDPQVLWDAELTPTSWYGVTTVIMGNCGLTLAPMRPAARGACMESLGTVEAMSVDALKAGITWNFESFGEYLEVVKSRRTSINVASFVGHTALRMYEMAEDPGGVATPDDVARMQRQLETAMAAGAWGFSTSRSPAHVDGKGRPIPSRAASYDEVAALCDVLGSAGAGVIQGVNGPGLPVTDFGRLALRARRPTTWTSLHQGVDGNQQWNYLRDTLEARSQGANLWAQMACAAISSHFTLEQPYFFHSVPGFARISGLPVAQRIAAMRDKAWQTEVEAEFAANTARRSFQIRFDRIFVDESKAHANLVGRSIAEIAGPAGSGMATMVELAAREELQTRFKLVMFNFDEDEVARLLRQDPVLLGLGDGGAHVSQFCQADFPVRLLGHFVRERRDFPLEFGVWRLTGHLARVFGFRERGEIKPTYHADLCVFNPATIAEGRNQRWHDLPAGADRVVKEPAGIEHVMVNGTLIRRAGRNVTGTGSGRVLRP
jgi:N-acyl-D-aspartate/D-glutamate deacylase